MEKSVEDLKAMASALEELQLNLEPVRDKALDQKAFYTGYAQCAEQMIKVIVTKMNYLKKQAEMQETGVVDEMYLGQEDLEKPEKVEEKPEAPLVVDPEPKNGRRKKKKEAKET
jgi:hypothetical protein